MEELAFLKENTTARLVIQKSDNANGCLVSQDPATEVSSELGEFQSEKACHMWICLGVDSLSFGKMA